MNDIPQKRPSLWYCLLGVPFLLAGGGLFAYILIHGLTHVTDSLTQVVVPGNAALNLKRGQTYTVFSEQQSVVNGRIYSTTESIGGLECSVRSVAKGVVAPISQPGMTTSYQLGGRSGRSVLQFSVPEDGKYEFSCEYRGNARGPETVLAVGTGVGTKIFRTAIGSLAALFAGMGSFLAVPLFVIVKRSRSAKTQWQAITEP